MESAQPETRRDSVYLLTHAQILANTSNLSNVSLYYNRISVVNNLRRYGNNYCWVHETKSQLQNFPEQLPCACVGGAAHSARAAKGTKCPQEAYVLGLASELRGRNLIVDFSSSQCICLLYKGRLYLYSNLSTCKLAQQNPRDKEAPRGVICEDCKAAPVVEFSRADLDRALYDIIEKGEDQRYGLTLLEHTPLGDALCGLEKVQDSVKSIGILEGLISDEHKESTIDNINVIDFDILLDDLHPAGAAGAGDCVGAACVGCGACKRKYMKDLNECLKVPINSGPANTDASAAEACCPCAREGCDCKDCEKCHLCNRDASDSNCNCPRRAAGHGRPAGKGCDCKCHAKWALGAHNLKMNATVDAQYVAECVRYANSLVEKANRELDSICSSLINQLNSLCQPPLSISIRFLEHFLCFEYLIEYSCDLNHLYRESLYGTHSLDKQNVILHEFIQCNVLTKQVLDDTFQVILQRIKIYTIPKAVHGEKREGAMADAADNIGKHLLDVKIASSESSSHSLNSVNTNDNLSSGNLSSNDGTPAAGGSSEAVLDDKSLKIDEMLLAPKAEPGNAETPSRSDSMYLSQGDLLNALNLNDTKLVESSNVNTGSNVTTINTNVDSPDTDNLISSDDSYKNSFQDLEHVKKSPENSDEEMSDEPAPEVYPYWWSFYVEDNTLGEGDLNGRYEGIRRFTRSYTKEESSTPKNKKSANGANYLLTRCVSSDFSTKSNINVPGLHSSRETLCPSEFNQSQPSALAPEPTPCFCRECIPYISNITRVFPNANANALVSAHSLDSSTSTLDKLGSHEGRRSARSLETRPSRDENVSTPRGMDDVGEMNIVNGLRRSIRAALDVGSAIKKKISADCKPLVDTLNVALLSSFRLGEFLFNNPNLYGNLYTNRSLDESIFELKSESLLDTSRTPEQMASSRTPDLSEDLCTDREEEIGDLLCLELNLASETGRSTFESDQYLSYDIVSEDDACSYSSLSSSSPKMFNKRKSPSRSRRTYRSLSSLEGLPSTRRSFEGLPSSRRSTRELSQTDDMYIYDMNNLSDKGEFDDWYVDSDSSKKSAKYVQKRMPPSRPSVSNLTEIYGSQDMLIPMGPLPIGVYFDASRKLWRCQWRENGKFRTKGFSLGHYNTLADARHACILFRCQVGNMNIQPEWLTPNYIKVSDLLNRRAAQPSSTPKKSSRKKKRQEDLYEPYP